MCKNGIILELIRGLSNLVCEVIVLNTSKPFLLQTGHTISWPFCRSPKHPPQNSSVQTCTQHHHMLMTISSLKQHTVGTDIRLSFP